LWGKKGFKGRETGLKKDTVKEHRKGECLAKGGGGSKMSYGSEKHKKEGGKGKEKMQGLEKKYITNQNPSENGTDRPPPNKKSVKNK